MVISPAIAGAEDPSAIFKRYQAAIESRDNAAAVREGEQYEIAIRKKFGVDHEAYAAALHNLGLAHERLRAWSTAEGYYNRALAIRQVRGKSTDLAWTLFNLSNIYREQRKFAEADANLRRALDIREKALGPDNLDVAQTLFNLGVLKRLESKLRESEEFSQRAALIREKAPGASAAVRIQSLNELGLISYQQRKFIEAEAAYKRALPIGESGNLKADLAWTLLSLANVQVDQKKYDDAEASLARAVELRQQVLGRDHLDTAQALHNLGRVGRLSKKFANAEKNLRAALDIREKAGASALAIAYSCYELGLNDYQQQKYASAEAWYKKGLPLAEQALSPLDLANYLYDFALTYRPLGEHGQAEALIRRALPVFEQKLGANSSKVQNALLELAFAVRSQGRFDEALDLVKRGFAIQEANLGSDHPDVIAGIAKLGRLYLDDLKYAEAEQTLLRALAIKSKKLGADHPDLLPQLKALAETYRALGRTDDAEQQYQRMLTIKEKTLKPVDASLTETLLALSDLYSDQGKTSEAEAVDRRLLAIRDEALRANEVDAAKMLDELAGKYKDRMLFADAEKLYRAALDIQQSKSIEDEATASMSSGLASVMRSQGRLSDAEALHKRSLAIRERLLGPEDSKVAASLTNLALVVSDLGRDSEAESLYKRALAIYGRLDQLYPSRMAFDDRIVTPLNNLASIYNDQGRFDEAETLYQKVVTIRTQLYGVGDSGVARTLNNLGALNRVQGRLEKAEEFSSRALPIAEKTAGPKSPLFAYILRSLALTYQMQGRYAEADQLYQKTLDIAQRSGFGQSLQKAGALNDAGSLYLLQTRYPEAEAALSEALAIRTDKLGALHPDTAETLQLLARVSEAAGKREDALDYSRRATAALVTGAAGASVSIQKGDSRARRQTHADYFEQHLRSLSLLRGSAAAQSSPEADEEAFKTAQWATHSSAAVALQQMAARFATGSGELLSLARERQDLDASWRELDQRLAEAMSKTETSATRASTGELRAQVAALEGRRREIGAELDAKFPEYAALVSPKPLSIGRAKALLGPDEALVYFVVGERKSYVFALTREGMSWRELAPGAAVLSEKVKNLRRGLHDFEDQRLEFLRSGKRLELFDPSIAHELYTTLLSPVDELVGSKQHVLVVPSGPLTTLPFHLLVTAKPPIAKPDLKDIGVYRDVAWLIKRQAVTVLPSVSSLEALRASTARQPAAKAMIGFGDPIFDPAERGRALADQRAAGRVAANTRAYTDFWKGAGLDRANLARSLPSLLDTATELKTVAKNLGAPASDVLLDRDATEANVKTRPLTDYRVVYFATHGLVAGDVTGVGEPSLALTLPKEPSPLDDGLLTASEIAQLKLNADWVVLSACNTMAGDKPGAEALSGLARAFFYAGARALLVSHWSIDSTSATRLTTATFARIADQSTLGRSEALRRAMIDYMNDNANPLNAYPAFWAPFSVVGEGSLR
ncbi:conserved hypothetical protein [Bradyrhizobium oligotrophicum S58]|uniref:CHAT domain-containing protein n=2 Tax=Bradyrhizobium oligotrophicum TaxID=44255 RepID=M4ZM31_9BRAD|nr:conserved hypothetical protein [Bradyrhizobium oligotrophicum S58]